MDPAQGREAEVAAGPMVRACGQGMAGVEEALEASKTE